MKEFYYKETEEYLHTIRECFGTDKELLDRWHVCAPAALEVCIRKTFNDLHNSESLKFFEIHCTNEDINELVGFFGTEYVFDKNIGEYLSFLTSFFIKPKYRNRDTMDYFWTIVEKEVGNDFFTCIYSHNERAKNFIEKKGLRLIDIKPIKENMNALIYAN